MRVFCFTAWIAIAGGMLVAEQENLAAADTEKADTKPLAERYLDQAKAQTLAALEKERGELQRRLDELKGLLATREQTKNSQKNRSNKTRAELIQEREEFKTQLENLKAGRKAEAPQLTVDLKIGDVGYLPDGGKVRVHKIMSGTEVRVQLMETRPRLGRDGRPSQFGGSQTSYKDAIVRGVDTTKLSEFRDGTIAGCFDVAETIQLNLYGTKQAYLVLQKVEDEKFKEQLPMIVPSKITPEIPRP